MCQKIEMAFHFTKEIHTKNFGWFKKKKLGKHQRKTYILCGWLGGWYTLLRPHPFSQVSIYPNYAQPAASLRSNKCERPILGFHFFDIEFLVSLCAFFCVLTSDFFVCFCALFNCFIFIWRFWVFFAFFFAPFIPHNLTNSNIFFRILNPI